MKNSSNKTKDSHDLSYLLRHDKTCKLETGGWRSVENLVHEQGFTFEQLCNLVVNDSKGRFEFNDDKTKIRALYGHSVPVEMNYACCTPPEILYHGTSMNADAAIAEVGLKPRSRNYVHLTSDNDTALETGARHGDPVTIHVKALEMFHEGYEFYNPVKIIWLVREVPRRFIDSYYIPVQSFSIDSIKRKMIKVVCDSRSIIEVLSQDSTISSLCEIVYWTEMSWSINTMEEMFGNQLHIIVVTDAQDMTNDFVQQVSNFEKYTSGIIQISPVVVEQIPSIQATSREEIHSILHSLSLLVGRNRPGNLSLQDIATLLLNVDGEIKVLQTAYNDSSDIANLCEKLTVSLKGQDKHFRSCMVQISIPDGYKGQVEGIQIEAYEIVACVRNMMPSAECYFCYSDNMPNDRQIHISVFLY